MRRAIMLLQSAYRLQGAKISPELIHSISGVCAASLNLRFIMIRAACVMLFAAYMPGPTVVRIHQLILRR